LGQIFKLGPGIDRTIFAYIVQADVASATLSDPAFHFVLDGCVNLFILESQSLEVLYHKLIAAGEQYNQKQNA